MDYDKNCPLGITNSKEIEKLQDKFAMVIENIEKNISNLGNTMEKKFNELSKKIDDIDEKIENYNKSIPQLHMASKNGHAAYGVEKRPWVRN